MERHSLDSSSGNSSTGARIRRYIKATELQDSLLTQTESTSQTTTGAASDKDLRSELSSFNFEAGASARLNPIEEEVTKEAVSEVSVESAPDNAYKNKLKYKMNQEFQAPAASPEAVGSAFDEAEVSPPVSIPNTFKYKLHPNAKTKSTIEIVETEPTLHEATETETTHQTSHADEKDSHPTKEPDHCDTPDWMPAELGDRWEDLGSSVRITRPSLKLDLNLNLSSTNTIMHNSKEKNTTPMWKKVNKEFQNQKSQPQLQNIFLSIDSLKLDDKSENNHLVSLTLSTPMVSMNRSRPMDKKGNFPNPESPLKLFADNYNTFTRTKLRDVLENLNKPTPNKIPEIANDDIETPAKLTPAKRTPAKPTPVKIKNFVKSGSYTQEHFMQNADNVFKNIKKRGFPAATLKPSNDTIFSTTTSTPKKNDDLRSYSSFTSDFDASHSDSNEKGFSSNAFSTMDKTDKAHSTLEKAYRTIDEDGYSYTVDQQQDQYTFDSSKPEYTHESKPEYTYESKPEYTFESGKSKEGGSGSSYTYDEVTTDPSRSPQKKTDELMELGSFANVEPSSDVRYLEERVEYLEQLLREKNEPVHIDSANFTEEETEDAFIQWKRASQLRLRQSRVMREMTNEGIGQLKPGDVVPPTSYHNMVLDTENQKWVSNDDKENRGSLDSIVDLDTSDHDTSILKSPRRSPRREGLEVSFDLPEHDEPSQLHDLTFSQMRKSLVAVITEVLAQDKVAWGSVDEVDLANNHLANVKDLNKFLPKVAVAKLSHNQLSYLDGLPRALMRLEVAHNRIDNMTLFRQFHDLQVLDANHNQLTSTSGFKHNVHLTHLDLSNNQIVQLDGLRSLRHLTKLNLAWNRLSGELDLAHFGFASLQELNLQGNNLVSVTGIEACPELRILDLNENKLTSLSSKRHPTLKKLLVKFNQLLHLDVGVFPGLRVLRFDGTPLTSLTELKALRYLEEVSCKGQQSPNVLASVLGAVDLQRLDMAGCAVDFLHVEPFLNLNQLSLMATGLDKIPANFGTLFPNLRELDLNFNRLKNIHNLSGCHHLRRLCLLGNQISKVGRLLEGVDGSRAKLKVLDVRLNPLTVDIYPYVFSHEELKGHPLSYMFESFDEVFSFATYYRSLVRGTDWHHRDAVFVDKLSGEPHRLEKRVNYEAMVMRYLYNLRHLDGGVVTPEKRTQLCNRR